MLNRHGLVSQASLETPSTFLQVCLYDLKFLESNFPRSLFGFSVIEHSILLLHLLCVMSSYSLVVSEQFSQVAIFLRENSARAGLLQTEDSLPSSYDWVLCWSPWTPYFIAVPFFWHHVCPWFSCSVLMAYAWINNYCGVSNCYYFVIPIKSFST